jgi:hypothetical protein
MITRESKRIVSVKVTREVDTDPDYSFLGEYSDTPDDYAIVATGEYKGEFVDQLPCECGHAYWQHARENDPRLQSEDFEVGQCYVDGCDCEDYDPVEVQRGREYRYFNSGSIDKGNTDEENRKYAQQDFERMDSYNQLNWCFLGIHAKAKVQVNGDVVQTVRSGGLWGIESDSDDSDLTQIENEQLDELKDQLHAIGFNKRAIAAAFRNVERESD